MQRASTRVLANGLLPTMCYPGEVHRDTRISHAHAPRHDPLQTGNPKNRLGDIPTEVDRSANQVFLVGVHIAMPFPSEEDRGCHVSGSAISVNPAALRMRSPAPDLKRLGTFYSVVIKKLQNLPAAPTHPALRRYVPNSLLGS